MKQVILLLVGLLSFSDLGAQGMPPNFDVVIVTDSGNIYIELFEDTPLHRKAFIQMAQQGVFTHQSFDRIFPDLMVQVGAGSLGFDTIPQELMRNRLHTFGALASGPAFQIILNPFGVSPNSLFYIVLGERVSENELNSLSRQNGIAYTPLERSQYLSSGGIPELDGKNTVFGRIVSGMEVVQRICQARVINNSHTYCRPVSPVIIREVRVME